MYLNGALLVAQPDPVGHFLCLFLTLDYVTRHLGRWICYREPSTRWDRHSTCLPGACKVCKNV